MTVVRLKVTVALAQEGIKTIRLIALSGRASFEKYISGTLSANGWRGVNNPSGARKTMERILAESRFEAYYHTIGPRCKRLISAAVDEKLSALGDSCIFFFEMMQIHTSIAASPEAIAFASILKPGFEEFHRLNSGKNEARFREAVESADSLQIKTALEPVKLDLSSKKIKFDSEIKKLYNNILIASKYNNLQKVRKLLASYLVSFIDDESYSRKDIENLVTALNKRYEGFEDEMKNMIAIDLYYKISKAIVSGDVPSAIQGIRKYAYIFEGDPATKYYNEIDRLERILYPMITEKNLWENLK